MGVMGFYLDHVLPRFQDLAMNRASLRDVRARVARGLAGDVVEIGFGTGLNVAHYPPEVSRVYAVEPSEVGMRLARPRIDQCPTPVEPAGLRGEHLNLPDSRFDSALSTWTLCTIGALPAALGELRRVLKPGASFHFVEHGHAPDPSVARWQQRIEPIWKPVAGGCHLTRRIADELETAGFRIQQLDTYFMDGEPKVFGYTFEGRATSP
jgi:ubiquinone/menaquinone biosynthesis C-methylase UbiE